MKALKRWFRIFSRIWFQEKYDTETVEANYLNQARIQILELNSLYGQFFICVTRLNSLTKQNEQLTLMYRELWGEINTLKENK